MIGPKLGELVIHDCEIPQKCLVCESLQTFFGGGEASFWVGENYTGLVQFGGHLPNGECR